jgi:hypothetical protein
MGDREVGCFGKSTRVPQSAPAGGFFDNKGGIMRYRSGFMVCAACLAAGIGSARAAGTGFLSGMHVSGMLRAYDFTRYFSGSPPNRRAFAVGGGINLRSGTFHHVSADATFYTAHSLGLNPANHAYVDGTLAGYGSIDTFGQAYLQYQRDAVLLRAGDQLIKTPWINPGDSRIVPETYQGLLAAFRPLPGLVVSALRITRFKSRTSDGFSSTNLYNATANHNIGGIGGLPGRTEPGAAALGARYQTAGLKVAAWGYEFYDLAKMGWAEGSYTFGGPGGLRPLVGAQLVRETGAGGAYLGAVNANVYGAVAGVRRHRDLLTLGYDVVPAHPGTFANGDLVSPYTSGYATDPLYTTSIIQSLVDNRTSGHAWKVSATAFLLHHRLRAILSYARYISARTALYTASHTSETNIDLTYFLQGALKGLSVRDRLAIAENMPVLHQFIYNRVMLQYQF